MDRNSNGEKLSADEIAEIVIDCGGNHLNDWRAVKVVATILAESGGWSWIRPVNIHNDDGGDGEFIATSIDVGICQWNFGRGWWDHYLTIAEALNPRLAIKAMVKHLLKKWHNEGVSWDDRMDEFHESLKTWNAFRDDKYLAYMGPARIGVNAARKRRDLPPI